jgi:hypothetical protein
MRVRREAGLSATVSGYRRLLGDMIRSGTELVARCAQVECRATRAAWPVSISLSRPDTSADAG